MIIVHMTGGIGNQMFQYSFFRSLLEKQNDVYYETFFTSHHHNGFEINKVFNIIEKEWKDHQTLNELSRYADKWNGYDSDVWDQKNTYFVGNWQNIGYFLDENIIRKEFCFKKTLDKENNSILREIQNSNSVSVHVRRGDYTKYPGYFFQANWLNYYGLAVNYIMKKSSDKSLRFFVFSDDIEWCKKNFLIKATYIHNKGEDSWKDMLLMSNCKHNIIANSTFSWWSAWLNKNNSKIIISPKNWFLDGSSDKFIIPGNWIKI